MSTLADINKVLQNQTSVLEDVASSTASTNYNLDRFIRAMQRKQGGEDLEAEREKGRARLFQSQQQKSSDRPAPKSGMFDNIQFPAGLLSGAALSQFGKGLLKGGLLRAVPIALATAFADDIESWVTSSTGSKEIGEAASRASIGGAFGLILGRKFAALGTIIGAVATEKNIEEFKNLGTALQERINGFLTSIDDFVKSDAGEGIRNLFEQLGIDITTITAAFPSMESILVGLQTAVGDGLSAITGFVEGGFDNAKFQENWKQGVGLLAGVILALRPLRKMVLGLAGFALRTPLGRVITAVGLGTAAVSEIFDGDNEFSESDLTAAIGLTLGAGAAAVAVNRKLRATPGSGGAGGNTAATGSTIGPPMTKSGRVVGEVFETKSGGRMKVMQNAKGGLYTQAVSKDTPLGKPVAKWWSKFPRARGLMGFGGFGGLAGVAGAGALFALIDGLAIASIMNDESLTEKQKIERAGYVLAGSIGALGGLGVGTLVGGPLGGIIGSVAGSFLGDTSVGQYLGEGLMKWIMGGNNETPAGLKGAAQVYQDPIMKLGAAQVYQDPIMKLGGASSQIGKPPIDSGVPSGAAQMYTDPIMKLGRASSTPMVDQSQNVISSYNSTTNQSLVTGGGMNTVDRSDDMLVYSPR